MTLKNVRMRGLDILCVSKCVLTGAQLSATRQVQLFDNPELLLTVHPLYRTIQKSSERACCVFYMDDEYALYDQINTMVFV